MVGDPALIIPLGRYATRRHGAIRQILGASSSWCTWCRTLGAVATLSSAALRLREEGLDPGLVDEVDGSSESGQKDEIQEESNRYLALK